MITISIITISYSLLLLLVIIAITIITLITFTSGRRRLVGGRRLDARLAAAVGRARGRMRRGLLGIHYRGVQWEGGAVGGGSII